MEKKSISLKEDEFEDIVEMCEWALSQYEEVNEEDYFKKSKVAQKVEKALFKLQGLEWSKEESHFETK
jgi:hypothetical protein